jgi:choline kinase
VCVGYQSGVIFKALEGLPVTYYNNPFYDVTNSIASLWFARGAIGGESLILNADVFFQDDILGLILNSEHDATMLVDKTRVLMGDYFFRTTENGCIEKYGKELPLSERSSEYVGIAKISSAFAPAFLARLDRLVGEQRHASWWEDVLYSFAENKEKDIYTLDVEGRFWAEIDYFDDYERILKFIEKTDGSKK